ncbi:MAG: hypothetical protein GOV00_01365 [Candidatus Altiarchaeota archaeon]|nr:hypothetical protein [Candidatus Altiarchaeota archaeon]
MNNPPNLWLGLFSHIDIICRPDVDKLLQLRGLGLDKVGKEYLLESTEMDMVAKILKAGEEWVGGNAGNAAYFLGNLGIECNLSMPSRFSTLSVLFKDLPVYVFGIRRKAAVDAARKDAVVAHWIAEVAPPLAKEPDRIIFTPANSHSNWYDEGFFNHMRSGLLYLSGLHLLENEEEVKKLADLLEDRRKNLKVYIECGEVTKMMKFSFETLTRRYLVDAVGMNNNEAQLIGVTSGYPSKLAAQVDDFKEDRGIEATVHAPKWAYSTHKKGLRSAIDLVEAWALDDLSLYKTMDDRPTWPDQAPATPARKLPEILRKTGLGDVCGILDAMRILDPTAFEVAIKQASALPLNRRY